MSDIVERLRRTKISAPPEHPIHPSICTEAADEIERLRAEVERQRKFAAEARSEAWDADRNWRVE